MDEYNTSRYNYFDVIDLNGFESGCTYDWKNKKDLLVVLPKLSNHFSQELRTGDLHKRENLLRIWNAYSLYHYNFIVYSKFRGTLTYYSGNGVACLYGS